MTSLILFLLAAFGYGAATFAFHRTWRKNEAWRVPRAILLAALALNTASIVVKSIEEPHAFFVNIGKTAPMIAWFLIVIYLVIGWRGHLEILGTFAAPTAMVLMLVAAADYRAPSAHNQWDYLREVHVIAIFFGFAVLILATFCALLYYRESRLLKSKKMVASAFKLPTLEKLDQWAHTLIVIGFPCLVFGWLAGSLDRGVLWSGTAAEFFTLLTLILYALYIHIRMIAGWQGFKVNLLLIVGSVLLVFTYAGVSLLPGGFHP